MKGTPPTIVADCRPFKPPEISKTIVKPPRIIPQTIVNLLAVFLSDAFLPRVANRVIT